MAAKIINHYLPELSAFLRGRSKPSMVTVNLTGRCNQRCIYCEIGEGIASEHKDALSREDLLWIINEMSLNNIRRLALCGGEPFLFDGIIDVVENAGRKNIICAITTNGMSAYQLRKEELRALKNARAEINVSIDSFDEEVQSYTRGIKGSVEHPLKSIELLKRYDIPVTVLTVISKYNYQNLSDNTFIACNKGIRQVLFQPVIYHSNYADRPVIDKKSQLNVAPGKIDILMHELWKIHRFERTHNINTNVYRILPWIKYYLESAASQNGHLFFEDVLNKFYCRDVDAIIDITYDGGIQPCGLALAHTNIHENRDRGLMGLWSEATSELRVNLAREQYPDFCNACCHHFSRNMLASIMKYPIQNRAMMLQMASLIFARMMTRAYKKVKFAI